MTFWRSLGFYFSSGSSPAHPKTSLVHIKQQPSSDELVVSHRPAFSFSVWTDKLFGFGTVVRAQGQAHPEAQQWAMCSQLVYLLWTDGSQIACGIYQRPVTSSDLLLTAVLCVCDMAPAEPVIVLLLKLPWALPLSTRRKSDRLTNALLQMHMPKHINIHAPYATTYKSYKEATL